MTHHGPESHDVSRDPALQEAFDAFIHQTHVPVDFHARVMRRVQQQRARHGRWGGWESLATWWTHAWSPRGVWAATVCGLLSLVLHIGVGYYAWQRLHAVTRLEHALAAVQAQVREAHAERDQWQARSADLARQVASLQAQGQPEAPSQHLVGYARRPSTTAELVQALFPGRGWRFRGESPPALGPQAQGGVPLPFAPASAAIEPHYFPDLDRLGTVLTHPPYAASRVQITGYTDSVEARGTETVLARQRAEAVQRYLVEHFAIAPERLLVHGEGASQPRAPNTTPEGRGVNRRVEIVAME